MADIPQPDLANENLDHQLPVNITPDQDNNPQQLEQPRNNPPPIDYQAGNILEGIREMTLAHQQALGMLGEQLQSERNGSSLNSLAPKPFEGGKLENITQWLDRFEEYAQFSNWSEKTMIQALPLLLGETVRIWFKSIPIATRHTWTQARLQLITQYGPQQRSFWEQTELIERRQQPVETVSSYSADIHKRLNLLGISEPDKTKIYIRGLLPPIQIYVCEGDVTNISDAERRALRKESQDNRLREATTTNTSRHESDVLSNMQRKDHAPLQTTLTPPTPPTNRNRPGNWYVPFIQSQQTNTACLRCGKRDHHADKCWINRTNITCHYCQKQGHLHAVCKLKEREQRQFNTPPRYPNSNHHFQ